MMPAVLAGGSLAVTAKVVTAIFASAAGNGHAEAAIPSRLSGAEHTCAVLGCGGHDAVCWCEPSCWSHGNCCPDYERSCPVPKPQLQLADVNLVVTTDLHSWLEGRRHEPHLNATLGHAVELVLRLRQAATRQRRDIFFLDNGDINDGTVLSASAADHVAYLAPLMAAAGYDALNLGNHELYQRNGEGLLPGAACPVVGLWDSGYIAGWAGRYLTSNVVWSASGPAPGHPVGSRFSVLKGEFGTQLLAFGFLYEMPDHCDAVEVQTISSVVASDWFVGALRDHGNESDAIIILAHMDYRDELMDALLKGIRAEVGSSKPVQVLAGHSHIRGWRRLDSHAASYEAGCKLDTVGFTSFDAKPEDRIYFNFADVDGNTVMLAEAANTSRSEFEHLQPRAAAVASVLDNARAFLHADSVLGCSDGRYRVGSALSEADSLWAYYMQKVLPGALFDGSSGKEQWAVVGNGALGYDIYPGSFTPDDAYKVSPFGNFWLIQRGIEGSHLATLLEQLNNRGSTSGRVAAAFDAPGARALQPAWAVPDYIASGSPATGTQYDILYCDFDAWAVEGQLAIITGHPVDKREVFRPGSNTTSVLLDWFQGRPCAEQDTWV